MYEVGQIVLGTIGFVFLAVLAAVIIGLVGIIFVETIKWIWEVIHYDN